MPIPTGDVKWALEQFRSDPYQLYRQYDAGKHRLNFATDKFRNAFGPLFQAFADNLCPVVVDGITERLRGPMGWEVPTEDPDQAVDDNVHPLIRQAQELWAANNMDRRAQELHRKASRDGDAFLTVWQDRPDLPVRMWPQDASTMRVRYSTADLDDPTRLQLAAKLWREGDADPEGPRWRLTLYYRDRIERLWAPVKSDDGNTAPQQPSRWQHLPDDDTPVVANPTGRVPVFHFATDADEGAMGRSDLRDVIPLQDALNKAVADMLVAMEFHALPQRWGTGITAKVDPLTGRDIPPMEPGAERMFTTGNENAQLGQFDAADLEQFLSVQESFRVEIARVGGLPLWYVVPSMSGTPPTGEALKVGEGRAVSRAQRRQVAYGSTWREAMEYAVDLAPGASLDGHRLQAVFGNPATPNPKGDAETALMKVSAGVSKPQVLRELGYTDEQVAIMAAETATGATDMAEQLLSGFDAGRQ